MSTGEWTLSRVGSLLLPYVGSGDQTLASGLEDG